MNHPGKPNKLSPWNPLDHLRLLCWSLLTPSRLYAYRRAWAWEDVRMSRRIVATLTLLALFMPTLALGLGTLPDTEPARWPFVLLCASLILVWMLLCRAGDESGCLLNLAVLVVACIATIAVMLTLKGGWSVAIALVLIYSIVLIIADGLAVPGASGPAFALAILLLFFAAQGGATAVAVCMAALATTHRLLMTNPKEKRSLTERPFWLRLGILGVLAGAHVFVFWFSFLGGGRVFAQ